MTGHMYKIYKICIFGVVGCNVQGEGIEGGCAEERNGRKGSGVEVGVV